MKRITSRQNPLVARCRAAARGELPDVLLLDGLHLVSEAIAAGVRIRLLAMVADAVDTPPITEIIKRLPPDEVESVIVSAPVMAALSPVRSFSSIVALADRPRDASPRRPQTKPLVVVAIDMQDPGNLGAIVRVAEAGGATGVIVTGRSADPFGWKALRGSSGSALRLPIDVIADTQRAVKEIRAQGCRVVATAPRGGRSFFEVDYTGATAILVGAEGQGLPSSLVSAANERVTIPMQSPVESLNAAVAAALIVYEARRQRTQTPLVVTAPRPG
jgi:RNA methyltransferase, TrmH family